MSPTDFERGKFEGEVMATLKRIEESIIVDRHSRSLEKKEYFVDKEKIETRLDNLEQFRVKLMAAFVVVAILANFLSDWIKNNIFL